MRPKKWEGISFTFKLEPHNPDVDISDYPIDFVGKAEQEVRYVIGELWL